MTPTQRENESSFKPGERVTWTQANGEVRAGTFAEVFGEFDTVTADSGDALCFCRGVLRPAPIEAVEMYGTMPLLDELPETLPAGTKWRDPSGYYQPGEFRELARRSDNEYSGLGVTDGGPELWGRYVAAHLIDWTTVPRQPPKPAPVASVGCAACGCSVPMIDRYTRPNLCGGRSTCKACHFGPTPALAAVPERPSDPYRATMIAQCQHLNADLLRGVCPDCGASSMELRATRRETEERMVNHLRWHDDQARLMAAREAKLAQALADLDRPIRTGPLRDRDKYGQKLSLRGWPEVEE